MRRALLFARAAVNHEAQASIRVFQHATTIVSPIPTPMTSTNASAAYDAARPPLADTTTSP